MSERYLFDAWALMAYFQNEEPAAERVSQWLEAAAQKKIEVYMSIINVGEVLYRIGKVHGEQIAQDFLGDLASLPIQIVSAEDDLVFSAAHWKMRHPISYADAFAAATAEKLQATLVTGDPELIGLQNLKLEALRRA